ncbi:hypothetical protein AA106555_1094 [Neokomagataea thailandica NBRC 106555]|uniref:Uncharacterized protein n=1 Tax=Neokomagataea thailandica NBRC 106555 TaxID=1223520 RepID=A0ABQ0QPZ6_9PROT|nr:hypothetical protein AA106555_1094 [Neokomagataea thailandica NBRC 106555]
MPITKTNAESIKAKRDEKRIIWQPLSVTVVTGPEHQDTETAPPAPAGQRNQHWNTSGKRSFK